MKFCTPFSKVATIYVTRFPTCLARLRLSLGCAQAKKQKPFGGIVGVRVKGT